MRKFIISVNNKTYEVEVEEVGEEVSTTPKKQVLSESSKAAEIVTKTPVAKTKSEEVLSPLPGNIWDILVKEGQEVKSGDLLLILEAMKMENEIISPKDGRITSIVTQKGAAVNTGDKLVIID